MGYPMTYRRVVNRNGLSEGGYDHDRRPLTPLHLTDDMGGPVLLELVRQLEEVERKADAARRLLLGDLRRLEKDAIDEGATCQHIASRTGVDPQAVAAVLREFMQW